MLDINLDVRQPLGAARAAQRRRRRPRLLTTADGRGALTSTLCTLERCQRPQSASPADLLLVLDVPSARAEGTVVLNAIVTHTRSRNTCNVKSMISGPPRDGPRLASRDAFATRIVRFYPYNGSTHLLSDVYYIKVHLSFRGSWPRVTPRAIKPDCGPNLAGTGT